MLPLCMLCLSAWEMFRSLGMVRMCASGTIVPRCTGNRSQRIEERRMKIHNAKVQGAKEVGVLHVESPRGMPSAVNAKKIEVEAEKRFEIEAVCIARQTCMASWLPG